jgi:RNA polymerase sigma-70 factor (sigma-E family)
MMVDIEEPGDDATVSTFDQACAVEHAGLLRFAYLLCGHAEQAEDLVAESLARVYPRWQSGRVASLGPYTRRVMVNQLNSGLRRRLLERRTSERRTGDERGQRAFEETVADHDQLRRALLGLPPKQRAAVVLRYFEDMREIEVAAVLGTSVGTVKGYVSRGLDRLRAQMGQDAGMEER